ncbi:MAG: 16S rRNA processing protein RimM [Provencibacterium sp.]|nr:16S rRNA processing protein RimM [Provencibacterium sp.]
MKEYIETGKIVSTHGVHGEVKAQPWCDEAEFLAGLCEVRVGRPENPVALERGRVQKNMVILKLAGVDTVEAAAALRGKILYVHRDEIPISPGEYLIQDLLGLRVYDIDTGALYGVLCDVSKTGANDVWHIRFSDGSERLIPKIPQVVLGVDVAGGRVDIRPLRGLFE